ncbi:MAG TPA: ribonuclease catalytic domain-containing protein [Rectinemataceae bacterium]|nr:ribonuclease catalytic domain-containing protein [Rectinemataceae bacterium]
MFSPQSIALYKNRPVLVVEIRDRIEIRLDDGSSLRVRDKDLVPLHPGPVREIPEAAAGGDFDTARRMLAPDSAGSGAATTSWAELSDLVFGSSGAAEAIACWREAVEGSRFRLVDGHPSALDDAEAEREAGRRARKEGEAGERAAFLERAKKARAARRQKPADSGASAADLPGFEPGDERFLSELEALALGKTTKSKLCAEIGVSESPEGAQTFLLAVGRWDEMVNPHPSRAGCPLSAPKMAIDQGAAKGRGELGRVDLTAMESWAIDNAWSHDPDDAIAWDGSSVWVHVADPASLILPGSPADIEALARGSTLYLPELTSPMLPDQALERFGLGLSPTSPALSVRIELAEDASVRAVEVLASTVRVRRASYGEADALIAAGKASELAALDRIADLRRERRVADGAIEIDIPEVRIKVSGRDIGIEAVPHCHSSGIVREMMLLAGEAVARWAFERRLAFPYYSQESPGEPGALANGEGLSAQFARRRLMRSGMSGPSPSAHRGLGLPFYAQATSPLRRYQDLLGHMQLRAVLEGRTPLDADEVGRRCALAQAASGQTRQAERASDLHWTLAWLSRNPHWQGEAVLVGTGGPGSWQAYVPALGLETRLRLGDDHGLDELVAVELSRVDLVKLECSFDAQR